MNRWLRDGWRLSGLLLLMSVAWLGWQWPDRGLWYDETVNAYFAEQSWSDIWEWCTGIDNQMPLDFALRKLWGGLVGTSEFALRAFSFWCAVLSAAGVIAVGQRIGGSQVAGGLAGAAFILSGGFLYAVFEVRPYALALALFAWSSVFFWELGKRYISTDRPLDRHYWRLLAAYLLLALALLYTHYTAFMALAVHGIYAGRHLFTRHAARRRMIVLGHLTAGFALGYVPWLLALAGRDVRAGTAYAGEITPRLALQTYTEFYVYGQRIVAPDTPPYVLAVIGVILLAAAIWLAVNGRDRALHSGFGFALAAVIVPIGGLLIMVYGVQAKLSGRHGWPAWIGVSLVIGLGLAAPAKRWRWAPLWIAALLVIWLPAQAELQPIYNSYLREAFAYVNHHTEPGDVLILQDGTLFTAAGYYDVAIPWIGLPPDQLTNVDRHLFFDAAIADLETLIETHNARRVWVLSWQGHIMDPQNLAAGMLDALGDSQPLAGTFGFGDIAVARYVLRESPGWLRARVQSLDPVIQTPGGGPIYLGGYVLNRGPVPHGGVVQIQTWWQRGEVIMPDMRVSMRLYDPENNFYAQIDQPPVAASFGQEHWQPDTPILSRFMLWVPPEMPSGPAEVQFILYDMPGTFEPIIVSVDRFKIAD